MKKSVNIKYPKIKVKLLGQDSNAFVILGLVRKALVKGKVSKEEVDAFMKEAVNGDYDHLLQTCMKWVSVN